MAHYTIEGQLVNTPHNFINLLDGGDFTVNPWQRNVTGLASAGVIAAPVTSTPAYFADRWFAAGGASSLQSGAGAFLAVAVGIVIAALEIIGGYLMLRRSLTGWWILAVGMVLSALNSLASIALLGLLITLAIAYVHLQVKPRYQ